MEAKDGHPGRRILVGLFIAFLTALVGSAQRQPDVVGEPLGLWEPGWLDIHQLAYGRGNSTLAVLPDGTTLLIDAGAVESGIEYADPVPNNSRTPSEWIVSYLRRALEGRQLQLDFAMLSHFHGDHMGQITDRTPRSSGGHYALSGITAVGDSIPISTLLDRAWPDYDYPVELDFPPIQNYREFVRVHRTRGLVIERFKVGSKDQIHLVHEADKYPNFSVRNLAGNGVVWTGVGQNTRSHFPPLTSLARADYPTENMCSLALRISYGGFDYFTAGDLPGVSDAGFPQWGLVELPLARVVGPTEVYLVNHHGSLDPASPSLLEALRPQVHIIPAWAPTHPAPSVLKRLLSTRYYPEPRDVFATVIRPPTGPVTGSRMDRVKSTRGHIVVRVEPGGDRYWVVVASPDSDSYPVDSIHGPYTTS